MFKQSLPPKTMTYVALPTTSSTLRLQVCRSEAEHRGKPLLSHLGLVIKDTLLQGKQSSRLCSQERGQRLSALMCQCLFPSAGTVLSQKLVLLCGHWDGDTKVEQSIAPSVASSQGPPAQSWPSHGDPFD